MNPMSEYTEDEIVFAYQMVGNGAEFRSVIDALFPDAEYPELMAMTLAGETYAWYKRQTPERLMRLAGVSFEKW